MRGEVRWLTAEIVKGRIIPACAGRSTFASWIGSGMRDHPRVCGEKLSDWFLPLVGIGSSPRVRGEATWLGRGGRPRGIIPACAGRSNPSLERNNAFRDHPRVCGEKAINAASATTPTGSSPRVRGEGSRRHRRPVRRRIIPACAGRRITLAIDGNTGKDHPRVCGEKVRTWILCLRQKGSSPRVRGEAIRRHRRQARDGIIPACAGRRTGRSRPLRLSGDHPRVCGEKQTRQETA